MQILFFLLTSGFVMAKNTSVSSRPALAELSPSFVPTPIPSADRSSPSITTPTPAHIYMAKALVMPQALFMPPLSTAAPTGKLSQLPTSIPFSLPVPPLFLNSPSKSVFGKGKIKKDNSQSASNLSSEPSSRPFSPKDGDKFQGNKSFYVEYVCPLDVAGNSYKAIMNHSTGEWECVLVTYEYRCPEGWWVYQTTRGERECILIPTEEALPSWPAPEYNNQTRRYECQPQQGIATTSYYNMGNGKFECRTEGLESSEKAPSPSLLDPSDLARNSFVQALRELYVGLVDFDTYMRQKGQAPPKQLTALLDNQLLQQLARSTPD